MASGFVALALEPWMLSNRTMLVMTMLLSTVILGGWVNNALPVQSVATLMDVYLLAAVVVLGVLELTNLVSFYLAKDQQTATGDAYDNARILDAVVAGAAPLWVAFTAAAAAFPAGGAVPSATRGATAAVAKEPPALMLAVAPPPPAPPPAPPTRRHGLAIPSPTS